MAVFKPGDRICGRFAVEALIGVGGMSEVYRGRDPKLHHRPVAIKVLRAQAPGDRDLRDRVRAEARSLSALNHPHIAVIYDVCSHDGLDVMVMELVEGETLAARLRQGRLSNAVALRYAEQIADALAYAHSQGVVHRDVKPSNIVVTSQGAKLLDFGLASLARPATTFTGSGAGEPDNDDAHSGGTPFYMAPEQVAGLQSDPRTDIYAFGLVLCQMLTGFTPDAASGLSTRTLIGGLLEQIASRPLRLLAERCVAGNANERWQHASDLRYALAALSEVVEGRPASAPAPPQRPILSRVLTAAAVGALAVTVAWWVTSQRPPTVQYQFAILPPPGTHFVALETGGPAAISPDGQTVAVVAADESGTTRIWTHSLNALEATSLRGTEGGSHPFWSPDSRFIGFFAQGRLQRIAATGGATRTIAEAPQGRGGAWSVNGVIVFAPGFTDSLFRVPAEGGDIEPVTAIDFSNRETSHRWPVFLPDGRRFLFYVRSDRAEVSGLYLGALDSGQRTRVGDMRSSAAYAKTGSGDEYLVFAHEGFLAAQRFSPTEGRLVGEMARILQLTPPEEDTSVAPVSVSTTGVLVHGGGSTFQQTLTWVDRTGRTLETTAAQGQYRNLRLSPDGRSVALERLDLRTGLGRVWVFDLGRNVQQLLDAAPGASYSPIWSPNGSSLLFALYRGAQWDLVQRDATSESDLKVLRPGSVRTSAERPAQAATDWSQDGKWIIYQERVPGGQWDIGAMEVSTATTRTVVGSEHSEHQGQLSPDGSWLAYTSNASGRDEVYVQKFPSLAPRFRVSTAGGSQPKWRGDGRELFYIDPNQALMSVTVDGRSDPLRLSSSRTLFRPVIAPAAGLIFVSNYDVDRRGNRFLVAGPPEPQNVHQQFSVIVNWIAQVAAR